MSDAVLHLASGNIAAARAYFNSEGTRHNRAGEGFIDRNMKAAISFLPEYKRC